DQEPAPRADRSGDRSGCIRRADDDRRRRALLGLRRFSLSRAGPRRPGSDRSGPDVACSGWWRTGAPVVDAQAVSVRRWRDRMIASARYVHTNLIARDWRSLARFYQDVFGCIPVPPERDYSGAELDAGTGIPGARLQGAHLRLPGHGADGPTL